MQRQLTFRRVSEDEEIKAAGLHIDFDEIARKGSMSREEGLIAKWYGVYGSRQPGNLMTRMAIPGGVITAAQARQIADTAENYAQGNINITTRTALQYHWVKIKNVPLTLRELHSEGISTLHGCGDVARNVTACQMAENCPHRVFDVRPYAVECARFITSCRDLDNLPRKYKINWSGCTAGCAQPYMNCLGIMAIRCRINGRDKAGFKAVIGGGMGWRGFVAQDLFSFVPKDRMVSVARAAGLLFRDHGDRYNRSKARLKFVVHRKGVEECRRIIFENMRKEGVSTDGILTDPVEEVGPPAPARPLVDSEIEKTEGPTVVRIRIPKGEMTAAQLRRIAELSEMYGDQRVYTTNRQNMELHGIEPEKVQATREEVHKLGLFTDGVSGLRDIVPCVGKTYCPKAVSMTRDLFDLLMPVVSQDKYRDIDEYVTVNITGCPNSCSPYRITDIGFRGMRIREEQGSVEGYEMLIGGDQKAHGQKLGDFKADDCPAVVETVLQTFQSLRSTDETLTACVNRVGIEPFREAVYS
ncbi:MAG: nitrite/sulfite reductase [Planctomycetota bacterium]|jgi:ferredoxin-nitrite reductase